MMTYVTLAVLLVCGCYGLIWIIRTTFEKGYREGYEDATLEYFTDSMLSHNEEDRDEESMT